MALARKLFKACRIAVNDAGIALHKLAPMMA
jgi:hypothetical protein